jgi:hypothetical protein
MLEQSVHGLHQEMEDEVHSGKFSVAGTFNFRAICQMSVMGKRKLEFY